MTENCDANIDYVLCGDSKFPFVGFKEASSAYLEAINRTGSTSSGDTGPLAPFCTFMRRIFSQDYCVGYVSYNGKVWLFDPHDIDSVSKHTLIFNPYDVSHREIAGVQT